MENGMKEMEIKVEEEEDKLKRYYVDFYDMFDGWAGFGFFTERLFDELPEATKLCDKLNEELDKSNQSCGEHYGVIDSETNREVYCGLDEKYNVKISDLKKHLSELDGPKERKKDGNAQKDGSKDGYQEVADEIAFVIKDDLFDSTGFDGARIADVLRRRFSIDDEQVGKILMSNVTMLHLYSGDTFTIPMFGMLSFEEFDIKPIISGKSFPNFDIRNRYMGYTDDNVFHRVNWWTEFVNSVKRNPSLVLISIVVTYAMMSMLLNL